MHKNWKSTHEVTLSARDFSCAVSGFGQVLKSDPREIDSTKKMPLHLFGNDVLMFRLDQASSHIKKVLSADVTE